jgi:hypothetical protein
MQKLSFISFLVLISNFAAAKDQFRCEKTLQNSKYVISGCAPYNLLPVDSTECRYISIQKDDEIISQVDMWGAYSIGADDASMIGFRKPFMVDRANATFWLDYSSREQEADFKIGRKTIRLKQLNCKLDTPSWYTERLSGKILKADVIFSQTLSEKLKLLSSYLKDAKSFGVAIDNSVNSVFVSTVLSDNSNITFEIKKINGWGKPFLDYANLLAVVSSITSTRTPRWGHRSIDISREEFEMIMSQDYLQTLDTARKNEGSSGITFRSMYYEAR